MVRESLNGPHPSLDFPRTLNEWEPGFEFQLKVAYASLLLEAIGSAELSTLPSTSSSKLVTAVSAVAWAETFRIETSRVAPGIGESIHDWASPAAASVGPLAQARPPNPKRATGMSAFAAATPCSFISELSS
jgi:hypothetical protein